MQQGCHNAAGLAFNVGGRAVVGTLWQILLLNSLRWLPLLFIRLRQLVLQDRHSFGCTYVCMTSDEHRECT